ncbi:hypothetical protein L596_003011 [Steinernema carpocapsae]|uniref:Uncharacterized protein n=1 Tax=Steinernema carpocapsae TaxID=34508 RepID=A0A4U8UR45_STECR|nr:hypothetical protein L596_003011 [Steinernema carpocapsae]
MQLAEDNTELGFELNISLFTNPEEEFDRLRRTRHVPLFTFQIHSSRCHLLRSVGTHDYFGKNFSRHQRHETV